MKLNNHLIVTLPDFARHFSFLDFWENRSQFVRDMHPDKVYYWNDELKAAYFVIAQWINQGKDADESVKDAGVNALDMILEGNLDRNSVCISENAVDFTSQIIRIMSGQILHLPKYWENVSGPFMLRLHKIEVYGRPFFFAKIKIGDEERTLQTGEFIYVTELNGGFIEFLPNHLQNESYDLALDSQEGDFTSSLIIRNLFSGSRLVYKGVTSFVLTNDGYMYINADKKPVVMCNSVPKFMLKYAGEAFYVKATQSAALVLYSNGVLRSTVNMNSMENVFRADFDETGKLKYKTCSL